MKAKTADLVKVENLSKRFPLDRHSAVYAVNEVSFSIGPKETLGLVGESGSGKTTVGRLLLRLIEPTSGRILFGGEELNQMSPERLRRTRQRMGLVFQDPYMSLNPMRTVHQTVHEPLLIEGRLDSRDRHDRVVATLISVGLTERSLYRYPGELTASEQQRLSIARAIVTHPALVVVDEATSTLDARARSSILDLLIRLQQDIGTSYLFISHDLTAVHRISHRIAIMYLGRIVELSSVEAMFSKQLHPYSRALLSAVLYPNPAHSPEPFLLEGEIPSAINPRDECPLIGRCPFAVHRCESSVMPPLTQLEAGRFTACYRASEFLQEGVPSLPAATESALP